jgi:DNA-binding transcriptional regulator YdaS (Cro superfamily)
MTTTEAATLVGLTRQALSLHGARGTGPPRARVGGRWRYDRDEVLAWDQTRRAPGQRSTQRSVCAWRPALRRGVDLEGSQSAAAIRLGVGQATLSQWVSGLHVPVERTQHQIVAAWGRAPEAPDWRAALDRGIDLEGSQSAAARRLGVDPARVSMWVRGTVPRGDVRGLIVSVWPESAIFSRT